MSTHQNVWDHPGARWWKFDFHTHTPASLDTSAWQNAIGTPDEITPEKWLLEYMAAEIDCVAITDHNCGAWVDKLKAAYQAMQANPPEGFRELHLFPGVELSVNGGFHLLAIFDLQATTSDIDSLLGKVDYAGSKCDSDGATRRSAAEVVQAVLDAGAIPIPAHTDQAKGLLRLNSPDSLKPAIDPHTLEQVLDNTGILAMEVVSPATPKPDLYRQKKLNWAEVLGSDCHTFKGAAVPGSRYTWVKMAHPSLEGLRLALLDGQEVSIRRSDAPGTFAPFDKPEHFIVSMEIAEAKYMGRGSSSARLTFSPYFNALVGGRGTGKSTVIHALRLAYRREGELEVGSEAGQTFARFNQVAKNRNDPGGLRDETRLKLIVSRDGIRHRLSWSIAGAPPIVEDEVNGNWVASTSQSVTAQRFPVRILSQGQIAALTEEGRQSLLKVIDEAAGTEAANTAFEEAKRSFFVTRAKLRELKGKLKEREAVDLALQDVQRKLARFEAAHHAEVLKAYQRTSRQAREMERQFDSASELVARLRASANELFAEALPDGLFDPSADSQAVDIAHQLAQAVARARGELEVTAKTLEARHSELKSQYAQSVWLNQANQAKENYEALKADLQSQGVSDPSEYGRLVQEKQRLESELKRLEASQKQADELGEQAKTQLEGVWDARRAVSAVRDGFLQQTLANNHFVRIRLIPYSRDAQLIERSLREVLGTSDTFKDDIYVEAQGDQPAKGIIAELMTFIQLAQREIRATSDTFKEDIYVEAQGDQPPKGVVAELMVWPELIEHENAPYTPGFESTIKDIQHRLAKACKGNDEFGAKFNKFLSAAAAKQPELIDRILCWFPEDGLQVEYCGKGDGREFRPIGQASAGQRAAAMLAFLLAHGNEPLILDQPEDDLDNHLIYQLVVRQIRANKQRRQLIVVTHNPNIVVNGDAEWIHALDFNHQCHVKESGSLQDKAMREEICKVMEGGKDAFERRYQRLGRMG